MHLGSIMNCTAIFITTVKTISVTRSARWLASMNNFIDFGYLRPKTHSICLIFDIDEVINMAHLSRWSFQCYQCYWTVKFFEKRWPQSKQISLWVPSSQKYNSRTPWIHWPHEKWSQAVQQCCIQTTKSQRPVSSSMNRTFWFVWVHC